MTFLVKIFRRCFSSKFLIVRDLLHPAIYSYVKGVSPLQAAVNDVEPCHFPNIDNPVHENKDFWGRAYETSVYQWLPSYFSLSPDGKCTIETYINNLTPRDDPVHSSLYDSLAVLFEKALPHIEDIYGYVLDLKPLLYDHDDEPEPYEEVNERPATDPTKVSLRGQKLQVITKIVDYELGANQIDNYEGVWHVEGMSHEEIVLTCLYILDRDESIQGGEIEFKRPMLKFEASNIYSEDMPQTRPPDLDKILLEGMVPLGTVGTPRGRLVVFPNSHVHRVKQMKVVPNDTDSDNQTQVTTEATKAKRRIVVFFLVNPMRRIVSTREVAHQQQHSGGNMSHADALQHRLALMAERKYHKQDWNVRPVELCEH